MKLVTTVSETADIFGEFMMAWIAFERELVRLTDGHAEAPRRPFSIDEMVRVLGKDAPFSASDHRRLRELRQLRNETVHGKAEPGSVRPDHILTAQRVHGAAPADATAPFLTKTFSSTFVLGSTAKHRKN